MPYRSTTNSTASFLSVCQPLLCHNFPSSKEISASEIENSKLCLIYMIQTVYFKSEIQQLNRKGKLSSKSSMVSLNPIIHNPLIRVGGRLCHSLLEDNAKHPLILPTDCLFTKLLVQDVYQRILLGGFQLTLATLRQQYWILNGRKVVKQVVRTCPTCTRYSARTSTQLTGELPTARVTPAQPFECSGVDYAGPISVRLTKTRSKGTMKGYIALFVCMATRAVHLEDVEDPLSEAFIAAFHRFTARRGHCKELYSDQGTNFIGADNQLRQMLSEAASPISQVSLALSCESTNWIFNPPRAPHFRGLWEAAVKSTKFHLRRVIGEQVLTFSELSTLLTRIKACLNSRPILPLSDDPSDLQFLSAAHFLILRSLFGFESILRWMLVSQMLQHFRARWPNKYLTSLQRRSKWSQPRTMPSVVDLIRIRNELTPPGRWPMARITAVHPDADGFVRVVSL